jgi:hypothetical protein
MAEDLTGALVTASFGAFGLVCVQGLGLFLYLNSRLNKTGEQIDLKFEALLEHTATARRENNEVFTKEIALQRADIEDLKRTTARHEDLARLESRIMSTVGDLKENIKEIGRKVEASGEAVIRVLARLDARLEVKDRDRP